MEIRRLALIASLLLTGCVHSLGTARDEEPVRVETIDARFEPGDRGELVLDFAVQSPGGDGLSVGGLQWELWLENRWFAAGTHELSEPLPSSGVHSFRVTIPIVFRRAAPGSTSPSELEVGVRGGLVFQSPGGAWNQPFATRRRLKVQNAPAVDEFSVR